MRTIALLAMPGLCRTVVALIAITSIAAAQPLRTPVSSEDSKPEAGETRMPIALPGSGEVLGGNLAAPPPPPVSVEQPIDPAAYVCGAGDVFELDFWGTQNFRFTLAVDLEGRAFIAKVGFLPVAGRTLSAVRTAITAKVHAIYPGLTFDLTLVSPRTFVVHVVDNVRQPGAHTGRAIDRVSSAIAKAGGATGSRRRIAIKHRDGTTATADLVRYDLTGDVAYNPFLLDGDVISVPFAAPVVAITGPVHRAGRYELVAGKDLAELLELAGGFTSEVNRALPIRLLRHNPRQQLATTELPFTPDAAPNLPLQDDDQIVVRSTEELQRSVLIIGAVVGADPLDPATTSRRVPFIDGDTVMSVIDRAGGIKAPGDLRRSYMSRTRPGQAPELISLDLEALLVHRDFTADRPVQMNDTIVVPPMLYSVLVEGAVAHAGLYNYNPTFGIPEYIARAGGRSRTAQDIDDVQLIDTAGQTHPFRLGMKPAPGDAILVPERAFSRGEIAQLILAGAGIVLSGIAVTLAATR
jgi:protein involved in polysaccharide export with SLBB domain